MNTHNKQEELKADIAKTKTFNYNVYMGQDISNNCIPFEEGLDEIQYLVNSTVVSVLERLKEEAFEFQIDKHNNYKWIELSAVEALQQEYKEN